MKTIITLLLLSLALSAYAQDTSEYISQQIIIMVDGTTVMERDNDTHKNVVAKVNDFYNDDRIKRNIRYVTDRYSDVSMFKPWGLTENNQLQGIIKAGSGFLLVTYDDNKKLLIFTYQK